MLAGLGPLHATVGSASQLVHLRLACCDDAPGHVLPVALLLDKVR